ncbi:Protein phosphatase methylesterase 1 [Zalerion maritima]|uniref:Protein phosphatase methylesterase 1 n=1 Tax=Zalerion maritima TaxID=339359 RepID=A0AAD5RWU9_9PEZI|nr:Protein phosphatase methylesterase 1 [Zalerion maritima]
MSELQRAWARAKMSNLEPYDEFDEEDEEEDSVPELPGQSATDREDDSSSASSASSASSTGTIIPSPSRNLFARPGVPRPGRSLEQIPWTTYFERELFLGRPDMPAGTESGGGGSKNVNVNSSEASTITHHVYLTSPVPPGPLFITHHGAGSSALSFAVLSSEIRKQLPNAGILSLDARGHGLTTITSNLSYTSSDTEKLPVDLSLSTLSNDLIHVVKLAQKEMRWETLPPLILVGHSLGGAVVTDVAMSTRLGTAVLGYAVLDVVEGSAMDALQSMLTYLSARPTGFASLQAGIDWHIRSRTIRNSISARTSVPALLVHEDEDGSAEAVEPSPSRHTHHRPWKWRTDLAATQPFWEGWFTGLSTKFLGARGGKLLLLAGTDRLDTELTIGKYALQVFPEAGHFIHEDLPEKTALTLADFYRRNDRSTLVLPPKVSDLLKQGKRI